MPWLMSDARVLASADIADSRSRRAKGLLGQAAVEGALVIPRCRWVHTLGMQFDIDVAYVDATNVVIKTETLRRHRLAMPVPKAQMVIEAAAGAFERWELRVGDTVEVRSTDPDA